MAQTVETSTVQTRHSAIVEMTLLVGGASFRVGQAGPDFVVLDDPKDTLRGPAEILIEIDGEQRRRLVFLPDGISSENDEVRVTSRII